MSLSELKAVELADLFSSLSDTSRVRIISVLLDREMSVGGLAKELKMSASAVSHQLRGLRLQHIVRVRKEGRQMFYCLDDEHVADLFLQGLKHMEHSE